MRDAVALAAAFQVFSRNETASELDGALLVNQVLDPSVDVEAVRSHLNGLTPPAGVPAWEHLSALGFRGDEQTYQDLANSQLSCVLERKRGIPITLAVVLLQLARAQGEPAFGLNAPGHFLSRIGEHVVDPFSMSVLEIGGDLEPAGPVDVALRMLNNVKQIFSGAARHSEALDIVDYQLAMVSVPGMRAMLLLEKAELWRTLGVADLAVETFEAARAAAPEDAQLGRVCEARILQLKRFEPITRH